MPLRQFFADDAGEASCMRLLCLLVVVAVLGMWVAANIWSLLHGGAYVPLGYAEAGLIGAAHGCKAVQARYEYGPGAMPLSPPRDLGGGL